MSLTAALLLTTTAWAQTEALSRRQAKAAYAEMQEALYHFPDSGTLTWTLRTTLPGPDGGEMPPCLSLSYDLAEREMESELICDDPDVIAFVEGRERLLMDEVMGLLMIWHDEPRVLTRRDRAWRMEGSEVFALLDDEAGEFIHRDPLRGLPLYAQSASGMNSELDYLDTPDGAVLSFAQNRFPDGSVEIGMEMEHRLLAPGLWMLSYALITNGDLYLGELWLDDLNYVP